MRSRKTLLGQLLLSSALVAGLTAVPVLDVQAQNKDSDKSSQAEKSKRQQAEDFIKAAESELKKEQFEAARELLAKARAADPQTPGLKELEEDIQEAEAEAKARGKEDQIENLLDRADDLRKADKYDEALAEVAKAIELDKTNSKARKLQTKIQEDQKEFQEERLEAEVDKRLDAAERAIKANNFDLARREAAAAREAAKGFFQDDLKDLDEEIKEEESKYITEQNEDKIDALLEKAENEMDAAKFEQARSTVSQVMEIDRNNKDATKLLAEIREEERDFNANRAEREAEKELEAAERLMDQDKFADAAEAYRAILANNKDNRKAQKGLQKAQKEVTEQKLDRAETLLEQKKFEEANAAFNEVLAIDRTNKDARKGLEEVKEEMAKAGKKPAATEKKETPEKEVAKVDDKKAQQEAAKKAEEEAKALVRSAQSALRAGNIEQAEQLAAQAEQKDSSIRELRSLKQDIREEKEEAAKKAAEEAKQVAEAAEKAEEPKAAPQTEEPKSEPAVTVTTTETEQPAVTPPTRTMTEPETKTETVTVTTTETPSQQQTTAPPTRQADQKQDGQKKAADEAAKKQQEAAKAGQEAQQKAASEASKAARDKAEDAFKDGLALYERGDIAGARRRWTDAKEIDPSYAKADAYLEETEKEYNAFLAKQAQKQAFEEAEAEALDKMNTLIPFRTLEPITLPEFLQNLRLLSGIDFVIVGEVNAKVEAAFEDEPLYEVLDAVLLPMGLRWRRDPGSDTVIIEPDLRTEVFNLVPDQVSTINALIEEGVIARLLYGPSGQPVIEGQEIFTDPRRNILIMTDSETNIEKVRRIIGSLEGQQGIRLIFDSFEIDESKAPEIKALLSAILSTDNDKPYDPERKLILEGSTLIIKDTRENVQRVREILQDQNFLKRFYTDELSVATFNLTPVLEFEDNPDLIRAFADQVRQVVETLLYARMGRTQAEREGRRIWYDPATLQLTITDTPDRLQIVQDYIESLPQIRSRRRSKIIFLDHASASELVSQIEAFLGIEGGGATSTSGGNEVTKNMRVEDELDFNGAFFRVTRVNENDAIDENDDSVELVVRTGTTSQDVTVEEFRSEFVEDFEIVAEDVEPSNTTGEGRARLTIRYVPEEGGLDEEEEQAEEEAEEQREEVEEETGLSLETIENLNALFVRYENIEDLREVEFWVRTLDIPTLQVSIEIKFVEVVTNKAQQLKPEFVIGDLTEGFDFDDSTLRNRFAQDRDEYDSVFDPLIESSDSANLLKGTTVFNYIVSNGNSPMSFTLKALEAQGVINVVNGPNVTVLNTETADFQVTREFGLSRPQEGATGGENANDQLTLVASLQPVDLSVTPNVTRAGNITLDIDVEMNDFDQHLGQLVNLDPESLSALAPPATTPQAFATGLDFGVMRKELTTQARIRDGGTVVLGGWRNERTADLESGIPILRDIPFIGKYLFERSQKDDDKITLLVFLTGQVVRD